MPSGKPVQGVNDLATLHPEVAKEADGWDPSIVSYGTNNKMPWKCNEGHEWFATVASRTGQKVGCPECAEYGFNPGKQAWFYLLQRPGEQQFGITNDLKTRIQHHQRNGWTQVERTGPFIGQEVLKTETKLKRWLKEEIGCVPGTEENWLTINMGVHSFAELKEKSSIETSIF